jgi:DNA-binding NarL/FixJ family response regulator
MRSAQPDRHFDGPRAAAVWMPPGVLATAARSALERLDIEVQAIGLPPAASATIGLALTDDLGIAAPPTWGGRILYCLRSLDPAALAAILHRPDAYLVVGEHSSTALEESVQETLLGRLRLPSWIERSAPQRSPARGLSSEQLRWFQLLATGRRVIDVAAASGFSERELYRRIRDACNELQVSSRTEAIARLAHDGLIG